MRLAVRPGSGHKTGLYLDQADNRARVARGTGAGASSTSSPTRRASPATRSAAGAARAVCVESSPEAVAAARRNFELNGFSARAEVRPVNAFDELRRLDRARERFDLVVLDPPPFARGRTALDDALRGYKEINLRALRLLSPGGRLATFSCSHHVDEAMFERTVREAAADAGVRCGCVERLAQAADHPVLLTVPETRYLKGLLLRSALSARATRRRVSPCLRIQTRSGSSPRRVAASARRRRGRLVERLVGEVEGAPVHGDEARAPARRRRAAAPPRASCGSGA